MIRRHRKHRLGLAAALTAAMSLASVLTASNASASDYGEYVFTLASPAFADVDADSSFTGSASFSSASLPMAWGGE